MLVKHIQKVTDPRRKDIFFVDLKAAGLRLKCKDSRRWVPLHDDFLALGFFEARVQGRAPDDHLFPELRASAAYGAYGDKLGQRFTAIANSSAYTSNSSTFTASVIQCRHS